MMNPNHRGEELCFACGFTTGHAGYGEGSIGYVDGTIGPLCNKCNERLRVEVEADSAEIERLRAWIRRAACHDWMANDDALHRRGLRKLAAEAQQLLNTRDAASAAGDNSP